MKRSLADALLLVFVLEVSALLVVVSLADSALGASLPPVAMAVALVVAGIAVPFVVLMPPFVSRPELLTRTLGIAVFALGLVATFVRLHELPEVTLLLVGVGLFAYADHHRRRQRGSSEKSMRQPSP